MTEPTPAFAFQLLEIFEGPLRDIRFPDASGEILASSIAEVQATHAALLTAEAALEAAKARLIEVQQVLTARSERALAYARIYAADQPELEAMLEPIQIRGAAKRGPGRPARASSVEESSPSLANPTRTRRGKRSGSSDANEQMELETDASAAAE
ncbi:hypothetical protein AKJ09_09538 [Labilithrix luteola]|uniref:Uncharacterized protein n=1 Tax=Labilithrix luteola TaxID=1391654 RepID=A0A0K1QBS8_9BACT|nr:hypothetical protein [Labilithrix luteola]AKV02875.1 hypothetical protein AKJ09_09538 [Labilithrix luteola]